MAKSSNLDVWLGSEYASGKLFITYFLIEVYPLWTYPHHPFASLLQFWELSFSLNFWNPLPGKFLSLPHQKCLNKTFLWLAWQGAITTATINPFKVSVSFLHLLKTSENQQFYQRDQSKNFAYNVGQTWVN